MTIKHILVAVSGGEGDRGRIAEAVALAQRHGAEIAALHVKPMLATYAIAPGGEMPLALIEAQQRETEDRAHAVEAMVRSEAAKAGMTIEWYAEEGNEAGHAGIRARYSDLVIASPDLAHDLVFTSATPVLAFPDQATPGAPRRALIAWNGSREATHAVRDALPLMEGTDPVVLVVDPPDGKPIGADLARSLGRHGLKVEVHERRSESRSVGDMLLEEAHSVGADLLVMGAYGHSRFREWVLGGATETALKDAKIPVLLSH